MPAQAHVFIRDRARVSFRQLLLLCHPTGLRAGPTIKISGSRSGSAGLPSVKQTFPDHPQTLVTGFASRTYAGSMVTPKPGPVGTRMMPRSHLSDDVLLVTGISVSPLNSWNAVGFGMHEAKWATSRKPRPEPDMWGVQSIPAASAIRATRSERMKPP